MIEPSKALKIILDETSPLALVQVDLLSAWGSALAEDIISTGKIPPFDNSAMDGYAVKFADAKEASKENPIRLKVICDEAAGCSDELFIGAGQAIRIMTGAPIPSGADTVIKQEDTDMGRSEVAIFAPAKLGDNIRISGEDIGLGEKVLSTGQLLWAAELGVLASLGRAKVKVFKAPRVAILPTGDELLEVDEELVAGKIRNSNTYTLFGQVSEVAAYPIILKPAKDDLNLVKRAILSGLAEADVLLITGGVSVGDYDFVKEAMDQIGSNLKLWEVAQRPGKPLAFWKREGKLIFGLPGNPVSVMVCFEEYVRPTLLKMMGRSRIFRPKVMAAFEHDYKKKAGMTLFARAILRKEGDKYLVSLTGPQGSGILKSMLLANSLAVLPPEASLIKAGDMVEVHLIKSAEEVLAD